MYTKNFLMLQGICSPFFARLSEGLEARGHRVLRVNFNGGDWLYGAGRPAWRYAGTVAGLAAALADRYQAGAITDQILFGDCRPLHRVALATAQIQGIRSHIFEEGYFRPHWVTLERGGVNGYSALPRDPDWYRAVGPTLPDYGNGLAFSSSFAIRAAHDVAYHLAGLYNLLFFPGYRTHAPVWAPIEYFGYCRRLPLLRRHRPRDRARGQALIDSGRPFFLLPLQLGADAQIRAHSRFTDMAGVIAQILDSFSRHAPQEARLVIKNHPLDTGLDDYPGVIDRLSAQFGLAGRIEYMETGDLDDLIAHARGTVTVNSTVGALALAFGCPTIALGRAIYNLPGLTWQGGLDLFWQRGIRPDQDLFRCFRNTVIHATQVNGGFYSRQGMALLVSQCCPLLEAERSPLEELL